MTTHLVDTAPASATEAGSDGISVGASRAQFGALLHGYRAFLTMAVAADLNLFEHLRYGPKLAVQVAHQLKLDERGCAAVLEALTALDLLEKDARGYRCSTLAREMLLRDSPTSLVHNLRYQESVCQSWLSLVNTVRSGRPRDDLLQKLEDDEFTRDYILAMREIAQAMAPEVADRLARLRPGHLLDVGGGPGSYTLALLERCPDLTATVLDLPGTLKVTRELIADHPAGDRVTLRPGDYHAASFGEAACDLVLFSHVTHDEGEIDNRRLVERAYAALRPGGTVAIHDFVLEAGAAPAAFSALFAVHMLSYTRHGRVYTRAEYRSWLEAAGFVHIAEDAICAGAPNASMLICGTKPG